MFPFVFFFVAVLLCSSNFVAGYSECNKSIPIFPFRNSGDGNDIHAMLTRDRYIQSIQGYDGFITPDIDAIIESVEGVMIPYGYVKEMIVHFSSTKEGNGRMFAKIFLMSYTRLFIKHVISKDGQDGVKYSEAFLRFRLFNDGYRIDEYYIPEEGELQPKNGDCLEYNLGGNYDPIDPIDSLLIQINCETTMVKKILVKCYPYSSSIINLKK